MSAPPVLSGDRRTDHALVALARLLAEIAATAPDPAVGMPVPPPVEDGRLVASPQEERRAPMED